MSKLKSNFLFFATTCLAACVALPAGAETFKSEYVVSVFGISVAKSQFTTAIDAKSYRINGTLRSAGLAEFFDDTQGTVNASGAFAKNRVVPASYAVNYTTGKKKKRTAIGFSNGNVTAIENVPALNKRDPWVNIAPAHLLSAFDPLSGFLVKANSLADVCSNTLRIFDGEVRADLKLSPVGQTNVKVGSYTGPAMTCALRVSPISGYRKGKKQIEYLRNSKNMSVTFAPIAATGFYAPVLAKVGTQIGTVTIRAQRFEAVQ